MIEQVLEERKKTHGDFKDHARISQGLKSTILSETSLDVVLTEAIEMICHKLARIASGNPEHIDHWDDIAGYATLAANYLREKQNAAERI